MRFTLLIQLNTCTELTACNEENVLFQSSTVFISSVLMKHPDVLSAAWQRKIQSLGVSFRLRTVGNRLNVLLGAACWALCVGGHSV